jgi:hypothetical protein
MPRDILLPLACAAALLAALPPPAFAQAASAPTAPAADNEARRNIPSNFAHMTPPPRTVESINKDLRQTKAAPANRAGGGRGPGRIRQQQQKDADTSSTDSKPPAPPPSDSPPPATTP